ncbi:MAG: glycoside hydrolase family 88 protein [Dysgonamonadaceae bacterium]|jgi:rhamnogalacturonyl hydrolase YesR|nr:glycoside hydrolase family 88 protein [Dysgonamonadaceae bacterium]
MVKDKKNFRLSVFLFALFALISIIVLSTMSCSGSKKVAQNEQLSLSKFDKEALKIQMAKVADWQIEHFTYSTEGSPGYLHDYGIDAWTNGTLFLGMTKWAEIAGNNIYYDWLKDIGQKNNWKIPANFEGTRHSLYHADELMVGQFYLYLYDKYKDPVMLTPTKERVDWIIANPPNPSMDANNKQSWTWCDALFMAPPVYAHIARIENNPRYLQFMDYEFRRTYEKLYDREHRLFFRDASFFDRRENNGEKIFWGRGNGWVAGGLVNTMKQLPKNSEYLPFYQSLFKEFIPALVALQNERGYWHASLLDPESFPAPETSATALITYAVAYGINSGLLSKEEYLPGLLKTWNVLNSFVNEDGKLGYVQPIGADPRRVTSDMTAVYGVGAYLLAGSEIYKIDFK